MGLDPDLLFFLIKAFGRDRVSPLDPYKDGLKIYDIPVEMLKPHEDVYSDWVDVIANDMVLHQHQVYPIVVDVRTLIILDGHHRVAALKKIGVECVSAFLLDYLQSYVDLYPLRKEIPVSKRSVIEMALIKKSVYPPKTTKHVYYGITVPAVYRPIRDLRRCSQSFL